MKTRGWKIAAGGWTARSVLDCGGKRSAPPLSERDAPVEKCRRRFVLPAQSKILITLLISAFRFQFSAFGQSYSIDWHTIDGGGGGTSTGGAYSVSDTIGQPDASATAMTGGQYFLTGGFWYAETMFCGCALTISLSGENVVVTWPCETTGCVLEYADELLDPSAATIWQPVNPQPSGQIYTSPLAGTHRYFRLRSP